MLMSVVLSGMPNILTAALWDSHECLKPGNGDLVNPLCWGAAFTFCSLWAVSCREGVCGKWAENLILYEKACARAGWNYTWFITLPPTQWEMGISCTEIKHSFVLSLAQGPWQSPWVSDNEHLSSCSQLCLCRARSWTANPLLLCVINNKLKRLMFSQMI